MACMQHDSLVRMTPKRPPRSKLPEACRLGTHGGMSKMPALRMQGGNRCMVQVPQPSRLTHAPPTHLLPISVPQITAVNSAYCQPLSDRHLHPCTDTSPRPRQTWGRTVCHIALHRPSV